MPKIKINKISEVAVATEREYNWLTRHRGEWLNVVHMSWTTDGKIFSITIRDEDYGLFVMYPGFPRSIVDYELRNAVLITDEDCSGCSMLRQLEVECRHCNGHEEVK